MTSPHDIPVDATRVIQRLQERIADALLTLSILEVRIADLEKENLELKLFTENPPKE